MNTKIPLPHGHAAHQSPLDPEARGLPPMPWGWFVVGFGRELAPGEIQNLHYFDRDLVLFRTESGQAVLMDAYCPHLGAHLGHGGTVKGETLECPFHHWRFDAEGVCVSVPNCERVPPKARSRRWHVIERNGLICAWFHPDGNEPSFDIPELPEEGWTPYRTIKWSIASHPQEVGENTVDIAHMQPVHHTLPSNVVRGPVVEGATFDLDLFFVAPGSIVGMDGENDVKLQVTLFGLGQILAQAHVENADLRARYKICCTPIDRGHIDIFTIVAVKYNQDPAFIDEVAEIFFDAYTKDFAKDFPIWENKLYRERPVLSAADGPIGMYRKWARQFHIDDSAAAPPPRAPGAGASAAQRPLGHGDDPLSRLARLVPVQRLLTRARDTLDRLVGHDAHEGAAAASDRESEEPVQAWAGPTAAPSRSTGRSEAPPRATIPSVAHYFDTLDARFVPEAAKGLQAVFQWELHGEGGTTRHVVLDDGAMTLHEGVHPDPTVTIRIAASDYLRVINGELDGKRAFTLGGGKVSGPLRVAMKMRSIFPTP